MSGRTEGGVEVYDLSLAMTSRARASRPAAAISASTAEAIATAVVLHKIPMRRRRSSIAGERERPYDAIVQPQRLKPYVGRDRGQGNLAARVDNHGNLRPKPILQAGRSSSFPNARRERVRIGNFRRVDTGKWADLNRHARTNVDVESIDIVCKSRLLRRHRDRETEDCRAR